MVSALPQQSHGGNNCERMSVCYPNKRHRSVWLCLGAGVGSCKEEAMLWEQVEFYSARVHG